MAEDIQMAESIEREGGERTILALPRTTMHQFFDFVRERGVAGFAVGFILGGAVGKVAAALTDDLVNPAVGVFLGPVKDLGAWSVGIFHVGDFLSSIINFLIVCFVMFLIFKLLQLDKSDAKK